MGICLRTWLIAYCLLVPSAAAAGTHEQIPLSDPRLQRQSMEQRWTQPRLLSTPSVSGIALVDHGWYAYYRTNKPRDGVVVHLGSDELDRADLLTQTLRVPAEIGNKFGIRYRLTGEGGRLAPIRVQVLMPPARGNRPAGAPADQRQSVIVNKVTGIVNFDGFLFEKKAELIPGNWTIQIYSQQHLLAERTFTVYAAQKNPAPGAPADVQIEAYELLSPNCIRRRNAVLQLEDMGGRAAPAVPLLLAFLPQYAPGRSFDCGCVQAVPGALAAIGKQAYQPLMRSLERADAATREGATAAFARMGPPAVPLLIGTLRTSGSATAREAAVEALGAGNARRAGPALEQALRKDPAPQVRAKAALMLGRRGDRTSTAALAAAVLRSDEDLQVRANALALLVDREGADAVRSRFPLLLEEPDEQARSVFNGILQVPPPVLTDDQALPMLKAGDRGERGRGLRGLARPRPHPQDPAAQAIVAAVGEVLRADAWPGLRAEAAATLGATRNPRAVPLLTEALRDPHPMVREAAVRVLGELRYPGPVPVLIELSRPSTTAAHDPEERGVRRSAVTALGKIGDPRALPVLLSAWQEQEGQLRTAATEALGSFHSVDAVSQLVIAALNPGTGVHEAAGRALSRIGPDAIPHLVNTARRDKRANPSTVVNILTAMGKPAVEPLIACVKDPAPHIRSMSVSALGRIGDDRAVPSLIEALGYPEAGSETTQALGSLGAPAVQPLLDRFLSAEPRVQLLIIEALGLCGDPRAEHVLAEALRDPQSSVRAAAATGLGRMPRQSAVPVLLTLLEDQDQNVRRAAIAALGKQGDRRAVEPLLRMMHPREPLLGALVQAVGQLGDRRAVPRLILIVQTVPHETCYSAMRALGQLKDPRAINPLITVLSGSDSIARSLSRDALRQISGKDFSEDPEAWRKWQARHARTLARAR